ncbi:MAG TPA: SDR family NAD(P)-dependent oxidoreductase [Candidatus Polarisedimenticolaceae bacterium]|nr:SDR family NAD(P)-dependent oxidoreductase [Candidatus Polarisedimenticolaceae bacterium]
MARAIAGSLVLVTGASAGIGRAATRRFVERGARVIGVARAIERLRELSDELGGESRLVPIGADVSDARAMDRLAARVATEIGLPDVIVANAGISLDATFENTHDEALERVFAVNVFGVVRTVRPFVRPMVERGTGRILLISSIVGKRGIPYYSAYSASKFALHGLADALRAELYGSGVSVGLVCPSSTDSELHDRALRSGPGQRRVRPRRHSAESVAEAIVRMAASDRREVVLSTEAKLLAIGSRLFPALIDRMLARMLRHRPAD